MRVTGSFTVLLLIGAGITVVGAVPHWFVPRGPITAEDLLAGQTAPSTLRRAA